MKNQDYILKINNPCNESWYNMTKSNNGKFCSHCSKTVIDFSKLTDDEIIKLLECSSDKICGRLSNQQLNRIIKTKKYTSYKNLYKIITGIVLIGGIFKSSSALSKLPVKTEIVPTDMIESAATQKNSVDKAQKDSLKNVINGTVLDSASNEPLPGATVLIKGTEIGVITNLKGQFTLKIPDSLLTKEITLVTRIIGYGNLETTFNKNELPITMNFLLMPSTNLTLGEVIIIKKKKWWQFWK